MRLGTSDLEGIHSDGGIERRVKEIRWHPKYKPGRVYFDVGIAVASKLITFTEFVRPVCLPYLPANSSILALFMGTGRSATGIQIFSLGLNISAFLIPGFSIHQPSQPPATRTFI